jgi:hypothetical protein
MAVMPTGIDTPPTSDLLERFNAIMADLLACVTDAALKAAGVPWPIRMLMAPLLRRSLARWSNGFSVLMADVRAGRVVEAAGDPAAESPRPGDACGAKPGAARVRSAPHQRDRATTQQDPTGAGDVLLLPSCAVGAHDARRGGWRDDGWRGSYGIKRRAVIDARKYCVLGQRQPVVSRWRLRHGAGHRGPPEFSDEMQQRFRTTNSLRISN